MPQAVGAAGGAGTTPRRPAASRSSSNNNSGNNTSDQAHGRGGSVRGGGPIGGAAAGSMAPRGAGRAKAAAVPTTSRGLTPRDQAEPQSGSPLTTPRRAVRRSEPPSRPAVLLSAVAPSADAIQHEIDELEQLLQRVSPGRSQAASPIMNTPVRTPRRSSAESESAETKTASGGGSTSSSGRVRPKQRQPAQPAAVTASSEEWRHRGGWGPKAVVEAPPPDPWSPFADPTQFMRDEHGRIVARAPEPPSEREVVAKQAADIGIIWLHDPDTFEARRQQHLQKQQELELRRQQQARRQAQREARAVEAAATAAAPVAPAARAPAGSRRVGTAVPHPNTSINADEELAQLMWEQHILDESGATEDVELGLPATPGPATVASTSRGTASRATAGRRGGTVVLSRGRGGGVAVAACATAVSADEVGEVGARKTKPQPAPAVSAAAVAPETISTDASVIAATTEALLQAEKEAASSRKQPEEVFRENDFSYENLMRLDYYRNRRGEGLPITKLQKLRSVVCATGHSCSVCLEDFDAGEKAVYLPCTHRFHPLCIGKWFLEHNHCPNCRLELE